VMGSDDLAGRLAELTGMLLEEEALDVMLRRVSDLSVAVIAACDAAGVSLARDGRVSTYGATDPVTERLDSYQYEMDEGPCLDVLRVGEPFVIRSFLEETRWPRYTPKGRGEGVVSSLALPLVTRNQVTGALNLYSLTQSFDSDDLAVAEAFATQAAVALRNAETYQRTRDLVDGLNEALASRDVIGQAKGILMAQARCDPDEAFDILRAESQRRNVKLRDVAAGLVRRTVKNVAP
jgi:GAF domain-containing protein